MPNNLNPILLTRRIHSLEKGLTKQFALNEAAGAFIVQLQEDLAQKGAFIVALVEKLGGAFDLSPADLERLQASNLHVAYGYPDETSPDFRMRLVAGGEGGTSEERLRDIRARLRNSGLTDEEIAELERDVSAEEEQGSEEPPGEAP